MNNNYISEIIIEKGRGVYLYLTNGYELLDLTSGATVANLGHGNADIADCIARQATSVSNTYLFNNVPREEYRKRLLDALNPAGASGYYEDLVFLSSGSEIVDCAMKMAMCFTGKQRFITTPSSFHGRTINAIGLSQLPFAKVVPFRNDSYPNRFIPYPHSPAEEAGSLAILQQILDTDSDIAGIILEPYQGDGGLLFPSSDYFQQIEKRCRKYGILFILDEIQSGFGRTGSLFYHSQLGIQPDILCMGKAIANGLPCAALSAPHSIIAAVKAEHISNSFGGNPLSMAAAIAVLEAMQKNDFLKQVTIKGNYFREKLSGLKKQFPFISAIRGTGLIIGLELDNSQADVGYRFTERCYRNGLLVMPPKGLGKNVIKISPPLVISYEEILNAVYRIERSLQDIA